MSECSVKLTFGSSLLGSSSLSTSVSVPMMSWPILPSSMSMKSSSSPSIIMGACCVRSVLVRLLFDNGRLIMARQLRCAPPYRYERVALVSFVVRHRQTTNAFSKESMPATAERVLSLFGGFCAVSSVSFDIDTV